MDQKAFRTLLDSANSSGPSTTATPRPSSLLKAGSAKSKPTAEPQALFKPRKVTKKVLPSGYRDRATERRAGVNDYAQVEALRDDFEKRAANADDKEAVEQERRYLGGDETHTVLVKGLDFALLEQKKAHIKNTDGEADDEALEEAFQAAADPSVATDTTVPQKRSRNHLVAALKGQGKHSITAVVDDAMEEVVPSAPAALPEVAALEKAKQMGKFKPIGATFVVEEKRVKKKKRKVLPAAAEEPSHPAKKKKKEAAVVAAPSATPSGPAAASSASEPSLLVPPARGSVQEENTTTSSNHPEQAPTTTTITTSTARAPPDPDSEEDEFDIFANAGEYKLEDEEEDEEASATAPPPTASEQPAIRKVNWFNEPSPEPEPMQAEAQPTPVSAETPGPSDKGKGRAPDEGGDEEGGAAPPTKLAPLASSSIADVKAFLAVDKALEKEEKRKARKEKNKKKD